MCDACEALMINGVLCHETGCPDAWRDQKRECRECRYEFVPEDRYQVYCSEECAACFHGIPYDTADGE